MNGILSEGLVMMCIGMGTVLLFLCTLIFAMNIMSVIVGKLNKLFPETVTVTGGKSIATSNDDSAIAVAIAAAVARK